MAQKVQQVALVALQETQEAITAHEVQQEADIAAYQETQEAITAHEVCTLSSIAVSIGTQNFILSQKLVQTKLKSNFWKIDHHLLITAATVIQNIDASMQENLMQENVCYGLIQTMVNAQESGRALATSDHDQRSCELHDKYYV